MESKKLQKKSHSAEKNPSEKHQRGLCYRGSGRRCFCFGRGSVVLSMFWRSVFEYVLLSLIFIETEFFPNEFSINFGVSVFKEQFIKIFFEFYFHRVIIIFGC